MIYRILDFLMIAADMFLFVFFTNSIAERKNCWWRSFQPAVAAEGCLLLFIVRLLNLPFYISVVVAFILHLIITCLFHQGNFLLHLLRTLCFSLFTFVATVLTLLPMLYLYAPFDSSFLINSGINNVIFSALCIMTLSLFILFTLYLVKRRKLLRISERIIFFFISTLCVIIAQMEGLNIFDFTLGYSTGNSLGRISQQLHGFFLCFILFYAIAFFCSHLVKHAQKNLHLTEENLIAKMNTSEYEHVLSQTTELRTLKHDMDNHLQTLSSLIHNESPQEAIHYLDKIRNELSKNHPLLSSGNLPVDCILSSKIQLAQAKSIHMEYSVLLPSRLPLNDVDMCSLLGNLCDNAIEACDKFPANAEKKIDLRIMPFQDMLSIKITNPSDGIYKTNKNGLLLSTKSDASQHGIGLKQIEKIVTKYDGFTTVRPGDNDFAVDILIPLSDDISNTEK